MTKESDVELPFAEVLRRRQHSSNSSVASKRENQQQYQQRNESLVNIDDEIRRLEAELENDDDSSDGDSSDGDSSDGDSSDDNSSDDNSNGSGESPGLSNKINRKVQDTEAPLPGVKDVICLSAVRNEQIAPLPKACLPEQQPQQKKATKKRKRRRSEDGKAEREGKKQPSNHDAVGGSGNGLQKAVEEILNSYVPRSSERLPFYCRFCSKQYKNEEEFFNHRKNDSQHKLAVQMERKASYCELCRKQFTSPTQLKEHLSSRPHKEHLNRMKNKQQQQTKSHQYHNNRNMRHYSAPPPNSFNIKNKTNYQSRGRSSNTYHERRDIKDHSKRG